MGPLREVDVSRFLAVSTQGCSLACGALANKSKVIVTQVAHPWDSTAGRRVPGPMSRLAGLSTWQKVQGTFGGAEALGCIPAFLRGG